MWAVLAREVCQFGVQALCGILARLEHVVEEGDSVVRRLRAGAELPRELGLEGPQQLRGQLGRRRRAEALQGARAKGHSASAERGGSALVPLSLDELVQ